MNTFSIDLTRIEIDGRTTVMVRNIPNKYTENLLLDLFNKNHKKKIDFFYLPVDFKVIINLFFRIIVMLDMPSLTSFTRNSLWNSSINFTIRNGNFLTLKRSVKFATLVFRALTNFLIILTLHENFDRVKID